MSKLRSPQSDIGEGRIETVNEQQNALCFSRAQSRAQLSSYSITLKRFNVSQDEMLAWVGLQLELPENRKR